MIETDGLVELLLEAAGLNRMPRAGWAQRGVAHVDSVADHSFGVTLVALVLARCLNSEAEGGLDVEKALIMAMLHDLGEVRLTDLPSSAARLIPAEVKRQAEAAALGELLAPLPDAGRLLDLWLAFEDRTTPEGRLVRDADKLEMMVQCLRYEQAGSRNLDEFWQAMDANTWHYSLSAQIYRRLRTMRDAALRG